MMSLISRFVVSPYPLLFVDSILFEPVHEISNSVVGSAVAQW